MKLNRAGHEATPALNFDSDIFYGLSFDMKNVKNTSISEIEALPEVEKVWPAAYVTVPITTAASVVDPDSENNYTTWSAHNDTKVSKMHDLGYFGEDVIIAIIDSGIDYNHPALGGGFGPGFRVESGYDLVGDDYIPGDVLIPDDDPMDCLGHGTHVAGIAASGDSSIPGVAPKARLRSYKVFGCQDGTYMDTIIAGFIMAAEEGADVITASLGSNQGFTDQPLAVAVSAIAAKGILVTIAAGNSGDYGRSLLCI